MARGAPIERGDRTGELALLSQPNYGTDRHYIVRGWSDIWVVPYTDTGSIAGAHNRNASSRWHERHSDIRRRTAIEIVA